MSILEGLNEIQEKGISNSAVLAGRIVSDPCYSHTVRGRRFYLAELSSVRLSGKPDTIRIMLEEQMIGLDQVCRGQIVKAEGQLRSYDRPVGGKKSLYLSLLVKKLTFFNEDTYFEDLNQIYLDGYVCKHPVFRVTPLGRKITDLFLAVHRPDGRSDYIPCIAWSDNARAASRLSVASRVQILGRIQSREYTKKTKEDNLIDHTVYEVSIDELQCIEDP